MNMTTSQPSSGTTSNMRQASDDLLHSAGKAVDATRDYANETFSQAENKVRDKVDPMVNMLASRAQKLAQQSMDMASEAKERAQQSLNRAAGMTTQYVSEQPLRSVLIAAAVGAAVALLISSTRHRNHNRY